jgi:MFS family permease
MNKHPTETQNRRAIFFLGLMAFVSYLCFYPFRRAYVAATFDAYRFAGVDYKIWLIAAQVLGFAVSKGLGIKWVSELKRNHRATMLLGCTGVSGLAMFAFGMVPAPYNLFFMFLASLPLGLFYGVIISYLEGRQSTELLVAILTASFIVGSGFAKTIGSWLLHYWGVSEFMMPFWADLIMYVPLAISVFFLNKCPAPNATDEALRMQRSPMNAKDRKQFIQRFLPGLVLFVLSYVLLTSYRELRDNFAPEILKQLGMASASSIYTKTEVPIAIAILAIMAALRWVKDNRLAFNIIQFLLVLGASIIVVCTFLYQQNIISPVAWLIGSGFGAYLAYAMSNSLYFERMLAHFKQKGTVGFLITLADFYAYFGSILVLLFKNFFAKNISYVAFFQYCSYTLGAVYFLLILCSIYYYKRLEKEKVS